MDKEANYNRLSEIVNTLSNGSVHRTSEWYDEHNHILLQYQKHFTSFESVNAELTDIEFRKKCKLLDVLLPKLLKEYDSYRWFSLYDYNRFNQILLWIVDYTTENGDELVSILENLKI